MLLNLFRNGDIRGAVIQLLMLLPAIIISLSVHEYMHGYVAKLFGDDTAEKFGRLTLNPSKHIDPLGFIMLLLCGFGWAKPVPVNLRYVKNARVASAVIAVAGPLSNILLAFIGMFFYVLFYMLYLLNGATALTVASMFFSIFTTLNLSYAVFNLFPIPPLDGSRILTSLIPRKWAMLSFQYERYSQVILFILLYLGAFTNILSSAVYWLYDKIYDIIWLIPFDKLLTM